MMIGVNNNLLRSSFLDGCLASFIRYKCSKQFQKDKCTKLKDFPCGKPDLMGMHKPPPNETKQYKPPSIWLNPFCDEGDFYCPFNPRFDDIYYVESDKAKRKYWQTWVACPPIQLKKKKICCFEKLENVPHRRRERKAQTACPQPPRCERDTCPKAIRRCHRAGRIPPDCLKIRRKIKCSKALTPYPAFSECTRLKPDALPLSECVCLYKPMICEVWAEWRRRAISKKHKNC